MSDEEKRETKSVRGMKTSIWNKALEYRIRYGYDNLADFLENAINTYCLNLDNLNLDRRIK